MPDPVGSERRHFALQLIAIAMGAIVLSHYRPFFHDDAYISLRFAERLASGQGLTWNPGERIEGFSDPSWVGLAALVACFRGSPAIAVRILGCASLMMIAFVWMRNRARTPLLLVLITNPGIARWTWGGLETVFFAMLTCVSTVHLHRVLTKGRVNIAVFAAVLALITLTRPEGIAVAALTLGVILKFDTRLALLLAPAPVAAAAGWTVFRWLYFRDVVSNAARAKLDGIPVSEQVWASLASLASQPAVWLPLALASVLALLHAQRRTVALLLLPGLAPMATHCLGAGDHMPGLRFLVPALVLVATTAAIVEWTRSPSSRMLLITCLLAAAVQLVAAWRDDPQPTLAPAYGATVGRFLEKNLPEGSLVAVATAGSTPYFAPSLRFIDTLGLCDRVIAARTAFPRRTAWQSVPDHRKGDGKYVLSREPDVIILGPATGYLGEDPTRWFLTDYELLQLDEFPVRYEPFSFRIHPLPPYRVVPASVAERLNGFDEFELVAWIRRGSPRAAHLRKLGTAIPLPASAGTRGR